MNGTGSIAALNPLTFQEWTSQRPRHLQGRILSFPTSDSRRFEAFAKEHEQALYATALRLCGNAADARDLLQDTFERGLRKFARFQQGTNGRAWLLTIMNNLFIDRCRARVREARADVSPEEVDAQVAAPDTEQAPAWAAISTDQVREALGKISEEFRVVYQLHAIEKRSYNEIAEKLRINKATVGTRLIRARRRLKELLMPKSSGEAPRE